MADTPEFHGRKERDAHALAIGRIAMAWNDYQGVLSEIFADMFTTGDWPIAHAVWSSVPSDKTQRAMLHEAATYRLKPSSRELNELKWLLDKTSEVISGQRNIGIHTALWSLTELDGSFDLMPVILNARTAKAFENTDVLKEYSHYEKQIRKMLGFAVGLQFVLSRRRKGPKVWPERPVLSKRSV